MALFSFSKQNILFRILSATILLNALRVKGLKNFHVYLFQGKGEEADIDKHVSQMKEVELCLFIGLFQDKIEQVDTDKRVNQMKEVDLSLFIG